MIAPAPVGGAETVVLNLAASLRAAGHDARIAAILQAPGSHPFVELAAKAGIPTFEARTAHRNYIGQAKGVMRAARAFDADVLHSHVDLADAVAFVASRMMRTPLVSTLHGFMGEGVAAAIYDRIARFVHRRAGAMIAVSQPIALQLERRGVRGSRICRIPNAVASPMLLSRTDARVRLGLDPDAFIAGWIGRVSVEKGADLLLDALGHPGAEEVTVAIIGDGPLRSGLETRSAEQHLAVQWCGQLNDAASLLPAFDVLVLSSRTEGTPMVLLEAMHAGVPIIATRVGGVPDMLSGREALLVSSGSAAELAAALRQVRTDAGAARVRAAAAAERAKRDYSVQDWVARHVDLYRSVAER